MWKISVNLLVSAGVLLLLSACTKETTPPPTVSPEVALRTEMRSAFEKAYPRCDLLPDWDQSFVYRTFDSTRIAMVRLKSYLGAFGYNARALEYTGKTRAAYMASAPWLIVTIRQGQSQPGALVSSAIPQIEYLSHTHYPLRYISILNTQAFSGDIVVFDVHRKPLYRHCYTDGKVDMEREPMQLGIVHKVLTKTGEEDPAMYGWLDDVIVTPDNPYVDPDPYNTFCMANPSICEIGGTGPIVDHGNPDGPPKTGEEDGKDKPGGGGSQGSDTPEQKANKEAAKELFKFWPDLYKLMGDVIDKLPPDVIQALLNKPNIYIIFTNDRKVRDIRGEISDNSVKFTVNEKRYKRMSDGTRAEHWMHEFSHILYNEKYSTVPPGFKDANEYQHYLMLNPPAGVSSLEKLFRNYFGDMSDYPGFYPYVLWGGVDENSQMYKDFVNGDQKRVRAIERAKDVLKKKK